MAKKKLLIVDDEPELLEMLETVLKAEGHKVLVAKDGKEALKVARKELPDLIVLDIMMPEMDGWMVCRQLREHSKTKKIPIMILTAKTTRIDQEMGLRVIGVEDYLTKPFDPGNLAERVERLLTQHA